MEYDKDNQLETSLFAFFQSENFSHILPSSTSFGVKELSEKRVNRIMARIQYEKSVAIKQRARKRAVLSLFFCVGTLTAFVFSFAQAKEQVMRSGLWHYIGLLFTDTGFILHHLKDFSILILEAIPAADMAFLLIIILGFIVSIRYFLKDVKLVWAV
jgi:hypothetical protein